MHKIVELVKRRPGLSVEAFQTDWRGRTGPLRAEAPGLLGHVQSHALPKGYAKGELLFDGIEEYVFADAAAFEAARRSPAWRDADAAEEALKDPARTVFMAVDVHVIKDGPIPPDGVKNVEFVNRRPGMALPAFRTYWREVHGPIAAEIPVVLRYEQNHLSAAACGAGEPPYDGLAITWFRSTAEMRRGTETAAYERTRADEPNFLPDGHLPIIITREHVLLGG